VAKRVDEDAIWYGGRPIGLGPVDIVFDGDPAVLTERGATGPPTFRPMSIVAKLSPISATTELLLHRL